MVNQLEQMKHCAPCVLSLMKTLFEVLNMPNSDGSLLREEINDQIDSDLSHQMQDSQCLQHCYVIVLPVNSVMVTLIRPQRHLKLSLSFALCKSCTVLFMHC